MTRSRVQPVPLHTDPGNLPGRGMVLWMGTVGQVPFAERLSAAAAGGYVAMSVLPLETLQDAEEIRRRAADEGLGLSAVDPLAGWLPDWAPTPHTGRDREAFLRPLAALDMDRILGAAAAAGCKDVSVIEPYGRPVPVDLGSEAFAEVCDRAAAHGLSARLEAMPFSGIPDIGTAWDIVQRAADRTEALWWTRGTSSAAGSGPASSTRFLSNG